MLTSNKNLAADQIHNKLTEALDTVRHPAFAINEDDIFAAVAIVLADLLAPPKIDYNQGGAA